MTEQTFVVTRPRLAARLLDAGEEGRRGKNPWAPDRCAWTFALTPSAAQIARSYYEEIGKPAPRALEKYAGEVSA